MSQPRITLTIELQILKTVGVELQRKEGLKQQGVKVRS